MKGKVMKGDFEICILDTDNRKEPIKFNKKSLPSWKDVKFIEIKDKPVKEVDNGNK